MGFLQETEGEDADNGVLLSSGEVKRGEDGHLAGRLAVFQLHNNHLQDGTYRKRYDNEVASDVECGVCPPQVWRLAENLLLEKERPVPEGF